MNRNPIRVLLIEDNPGDARLIQEMLAESKGWIRALECVESLAAGLLRITRGGIDVVLLDLGLPDSAGLDTLRRLRAGAPQAPVVVVMSGISDEEVGMQAVQEGAQDYLVKGQVSSGLLLRSIRYAIERSVAEKALLQARDELDSQVRERTARLTQAIESLEKENAERRLAEEALRRELDINKATAELARRLAFETASIKDFGNVTLHYARLLTDSDHGFVSVIDPQTGDHVAYTLTAMMDKECQLTGENRRIVFPVGPDGRYPKLWGYVLNTRQAFYTNAPATHPTSGGTPPGHIPLRNFLAVPALIKDRLVGSVALANANRDYTDEDLMIVTRLANLYAVAVARAEAELTLRDSEQRYRLVFENSPVSIWEEDFSGVKALFDDLKKEGVTDIETYFAEHPETVRQCADLTKIVDVNQAALTLHGAATKEELLAGLANVFTPESFDAFRHELVRLWNGEREMVTDTVVKTLAGELRNVTVYFSVCPGYEGTLSKTLVSLIDITERKRADEELRAHRDHLEELVRERTAELIVAKDAAEEARRLAEVANRAKSVFLTNMSHELRTPLNAILGYADILKRRAGNTSPFTDGLNIIQWSGEHLLTLINDILDIARIEAGKLELNPAPCHLPTFLREIIDIIRARAEAKDLSLTYEVLSPLPATALADEKRLRQVLLNLLGNAVKFTDQGYVTLRVTAKNEIRRPVMSRVEGMKDENLASPLHPSPSTLLTFEIEDTGIGISPDQLERIFQPFEQVSAVEQRVEGAGLGLAISQQIVQLMGSRLQVKSEPGRGSTFWFDVSLPVKEPIEQERLPVAREIVGYEGERRRVLVVDDKEYNRTLLVDMLEPLGFEVQTAEDGQQAVAAVYAWRPDVILMDLVMPVKTGFEAVQELRQQPAFEGVFIIAVSASVLEADREKSRVAGSDAFLPKPIRLDDLLDVLGTHLKLTWMYTGPEEPVAGAAPLLPPPPETLAALYELARMGEILKIQEQALYIEEMGAAYIPFARKLQELAKGFEIGQINAFVKQFLEEKQDDDG